MSKLTKRVFSMLMVILMIAGMTVAFPVIDNGTGITASAASNIAAGKNYKYDKSPSRGDSDAVNTWHAGFLTDNVTSKTRPDRSDNNTNAKWVTWTFKNPMSQTLTIVVDLAGYYDIESVHLVMSWSKSGAYLSGSAHQPNPINVQYSTGFDNASSYGAAASMRQENIEGKTGCEFTTVNMDEDSYTYRWHDHKLAKSGTAVRYVKFSLTTDEYTYTYNNQSNDGSKIHLNEIYINGTQSTDPNLGPVKYDITYNYNGGTFKGNAADYSDYAIDAAKLLPDENNMTKSGYMFAGWYENSSFTGTPVFMIEKGSQGSKTLYAKWATPVSIKTAAEYRSFVNAVNGGDSYSTKYVRLENDIDLGNTAVASAGTSAKPFSGVFDGNGCKISGLNISSTSENQGLIGYLKYGIVKNVIVSGSVSGGSATGSIVGYNNGGLISGCGSDATVKVSGGSEFSLMSFNIRTPVDKSPNSLSDRTPRVKTYLNKYKPDIAGFQEIVPSWITVLDSALSGYGKQVAYRNSSSSDNEGTALYWNNSKFTALESGKFWLSTTPDKESISWGAAYKRVCNYAVLKVNATGKLILAYNTHLDNESADARKNGAALIASKMLDMKKKYADKGYTSIAAYVTGDFNAGPGSSAVAAFSSILVNARNTAIDIQSPASQPTYNAFNDTPTTTIDHMLVDPIFDVLTFKVADDKIDGKYISDHYGLYATISYRDRGCGGIVGVNCGTVINTYFRGASNGRIASGGIAGVNSGKVVNSYSACTFGSSATSVGGAAGYNSGTVSNCYCLTGLKSNGGASAKSSAEMQTAAFASTLNSVTSVFGYSSSLNGGYPYLNIANTANKLILTVASGYSINNGTVVNVKINSSISAFASNFRNEGLLIYDKNGTQKAGSSVVATGDKVVLKIDGAEKDSARIIVRGDVDCDGRATQNDYLNVKSAFKKTTQFDAYQTIAGDINGDGRMTVLIILC